MMAGERDRLFLEVKEVRASALEPYAGKSIYPNHGQRVVNGCRLMQSASDIFLAWTKGELGPAFLCAATSRCKGLGAGRSVLSGAARPVCGNLRLGAGTCSCSIGPTDDDQGLSWQGRLVR